MREIDAESIAPDDPLNPAWDEEVLRAVAGRFGTEGLELLEETSETPALGADSLRELLAATDAAMAAWHAQAGALPPRMDSAARLEKCVLFRLDGMLVALGMREMQEILPVPRITPLPRLPDWLRGLGNLRGEIVSIVDLRRFLGLPSASASPRQRLLLAHSRSAGVRCGLIVDEVLGIRQRDKNRLQPATGGQFSPLAHWIAGVTELDGQLSAVLDVNRLLGSSQFRP